MCLATFMILKIDVARVLIDLLFLNVVLTFMDAMSHLSNICSYLRFQEYDFNLKTNWEV